MISLVMKLLTLAEASRLTRLSIPTLWRLIESGELAAVRPTKRRMFVDEQDVAAFLQSKRQPRREEQPA